MTVSGLSSTTNANQTDWQTTMAQRKQYFNQLNQALQSGDLAGAQKAYSSLQQLTPGGNQNSGSTAGANGANSIQSDFSALGQALQSGDLSGAQKAFTQVQQGMQAGRAGHHHHHHSKAANDTTSTQDSSGTGSSSSSTGNTIDVVA